MSWIHPISAATEQSASVLGGKGYGLVLLRRLGLPVPPGFIVDTSACRAFLRTGRFPDGLDAELAAAVADLEAVTGRRLGDTERPLVVSVRSGAAVSMPGMMSTILNLGLTAGSTAGLAAETGDLRFALDSRLRLRSGFATVLHGLPPERVAAVVGRATLADGRHPASIADPADLADFADLAAGRQLELAIGAVFSSWDTPRARSYRALHDIPHGLGTAVTVQAMVFGNRDGRSGSGVAFSRDPNTGARVPFGEVLRGHQGEDVVSGRSATRPLAELAEWEPTAWAGLLSAMTRVEEHYRDACYLEFTVEAGKLWLLQVRPGNLVGRAAVRVAVDLADEGLISRRMAVRRISPQQLEHARTPRLATSDPSAILTRGLGASPGVAAGRLATTADRAARMAVDGPVILVRPHTSPLDLHGLAAASGVLTARGGPASHAAVVARAMGRPAVVGAVDLTVDADAGRVRCGGRTLPEGTLIALDGTSGEVVVGDPGIIGAGTADTHLHRLLDWADEISGDRSARSETERLLAALAVLAESTGPSRPGRVDRAESSRVRLTRAEPGRVEQGQADPGQADPGSAGPSSAEPPAGSAELLGVAEQ